MKKLLFAVSLLLCVQSNAKDKTKKLHWPTDPNTGLVTSESPVIPVQLNKADILKKAKLFCGNNKEDFFITYNVDSRSWAIKRIQWGWNNPNTWEAPGYLATKDDYVSARIWVGYEGGHSSAFKYCAFWADVFFMAKDNQTKCRITNIQYANYSISSPPRRINVNEFPHSGHVEDWLTAKKNLPVFDSMIDWLLGQFNLFANTYEDYMKSNKTDAKTLTKWD